MDGDLTSLAGASGTNTIYYRSAANTWSAVTLAGLTLTTGTLAPDITGLTAAEPALTDELPEFNASASANRKITVAKLLGFGHPSISEGRLTSVSSFPVYPDDGSTSGTLYYAIGAGDKISLYDGTRWKLYAFSELSLSLTITSGKNYDVFVYDNSGTLTLELSAAWTNDTTRADALAAVNGVQTKSSASTRKWVGMIRASASNTVANTWKQRFVWNAYNQVPQKVYKTLTIGGGGETYTYGTASWRQANADSANRVELIAGNLSSLVFVTGAIEVISTNAGVYGIPGIGIDSTTSYIHDINGRVGGLLTAPQLPASAQYSAILPVGYHAVNLIEYSEGGTTTFGASNATGRFQAGLAGWFMS